MNDWDKRYEAGEHVNDAPHLLITGFVSKLTPGRALDVASGTGRHSLWLAERGGKSGKKRAIIATARKLAVLLHHLWVSGEAYEPLHNSQQSAMPAAA